MKTGLVKGTLKYFWMGKVWVLATALAWIMTFVDLYTDADLTGLLGIFALVITSACLRIGYLQWLKSQGL